MKLIAASVIFGVLLVTALGIHMEKRLRIPNFGFSAPLGLAFFFAFLQILYYPLQLFHLPFKAVMAVTAAVLLYCVYCFIAEWKGVVRQLKRPAVLWILFGIAAFTAVFYLCYLDLEYSDSPMYLNYIAQNIGNDHINLFNLYTGRAGQEWDVLYLYQGYYHFASAYVAMLGIPARLGLGQAPETLKTVVWGMGLLYAAVSSALIVNITDSLRINNRLMKSVFRVFALLYLNLYYWRVVFAFYGNTYRSLFITLLMYMIWRKESGEFGRESRLVFMAICFAGLSCSSSFLFVSFAVLILYTAYLFLNGKTGSLYDMSIIVFPLAVYASIMIARSSKAGYVLGALFALYYLFRRSEPVQRLLDIVEEFIIRNARTIFLFVLPGTCALFSLYIHIREPEFLYGYSYYFQNHQNYDMVKDYFFVYSTWYDNLINILRWVGMILFMRHAIKAEDKYIRTACWGMILVFMNPLCTPAVARLIASNVFYRAWEVLFNPFTELLFFSAIAETLESRRTSALPVAAVLVLVTVVSNGLALRGDKNAAYGFYIAGADENYDHLSKMDRYAKEAIQALGAAIETDGITDRQPVVISQAEGTRVYLPDVVQLVTARDEYYTDTRVNEDLYQIARRHHPWVEDSAPDYGMTCDLLKQYQVDYVLDRYWENPDFDEAANACTVDIYQNSYFRLKKVNP